jgi:hypothetical protein
MHCLDQRAGLSLILADVPLSDSTLIFTPALGTFTPCSGKTGSNQFLVSSKTDCPF